MKEAAREVGRIDSQLERAGIRLVGGQRDGQRLHDRLGAAVAVLGDGGGKGDGGGDGGRCDEQCFFHGEHLCRQMSRRSSGRSASALCLSTNNTYTPPP